MEKALLGRPPKYPEYPLFKLFEELDLDKYKVARCLGIGRTYLDKILRGERRPSPELAWKMRELLEVPLEDILFPEGPPEVLDEG